MDKFNDKHANHQKKKINHLNKFSKKFDGLGNQILERSHSLIEFAKSKDPYNFRNVSFRTIVLSSFASLVLMLAVAAISFFLVIAPKDETVLPNLVDRNLIEALLLLQDNNINARIVAQFSKEIPKGQIIKQSPEAGIFVKMDSTVELLVSQGVQYEKIESFIGLNLESVKDRVLTTYAGLISIKDPIIYAFDNSPVGTVLAQKPEPNTPLSSSMQMELIVSRGISIEKAPLSSYLGVNYLQALQLLGNLGLPFQFKIKETNDSNLNNYITDQRPKAGNVLPRNGALRLTISHVPNPNQNESLEIFNFEIPSNSKSKVSQVILRRQDFPDTEIFKTSASGIKISIPFMVASGDSVLLVQGKKILAEKKYTSDKVSVATKTEDTTDNEND